jgi:hypothetical protein
LGQAKLANITRYPKDAFDPYENFIFGEAMRQLSKTSSKFFGVPVDEGKAFQRKMRPFIYS